MKILEIVIDQYYSYRDNILWSILVVFLCVIGTGVYFCKENRRYIIYKLLQNFIYTIIFVEIGKLLYFLEIIPSIKYVYFNIVIFVFIIGIISLNGIVQIIIFKKMVIPMVQVCKYVPYTVFFEIFLLTVTCHLEIIEWIVGTFAILSCQIISIIMETLGEKEKEISKVSDYPNSNLYDTRERQLEKFIETLEQLKEEPYAIMISGEWGMGKSSFAKALEKKLNNDEFIWVCAGSEKSVSDIMLDIAGQVLEKLKKNNIYIEKSDLIENYFVTFSGLLGESKLRIFNRAINLFGVMKHDNSKDYLNKKLNELCKLNKTIYLIIDDLDRCDKDYQIKMFKVIRESTELVNCKTIFLIDKKVFFDNENSVNYIEKYISYTLDLCKVDCEELIKYYIEEILSDNFFKGLDKVLLKDRNIIEIKNMIENYPQNVVVILKNKMIEIKKDTKKKSEKEDEHVKELINVISEIEKNISNSRKIKNYLKGIRRDVFNLNIEIEKCSGEFKSEDWIEGIIQVQFVKNILPEIFTEIKMYASIEEFYEKCGGHNIDTIWGINFDIEFYSEKKNILLNNIIYKLDIIDFLYIKTKKEKYLSELYSNKANIRNINQYVQYVQSYKDLYRIIKICETQEFDWYINKEKFLNKVFESLYNQLSQFKTDDEEFLNFSRCLVNWAAKSGLSEKGKRICIQGGDMIIRKCMLDNVLQFRKVLVILFPVIDVEDNWAPDVTFSTDNFFKKLKEIDKDSKYRGLEEDANKWVSITKYYRNLEIELKKEKYKNIGIDIKELFTNINIVCEVCKFWNDVEEIINQKENKEIVEFNQYFDLDNYSVKDNVFSNVSNLLQALIVLKKYYEEKKNCYESDYSFLLLRLSYKIIKKCELESKWLGDKGKEVNDKLIEISNIVCMIDQVSDKYAQDTIDRINIYIYKFQMYCK